MTANKNDSARDWLAAHLADGSPHLAGGIFAAGVMAGFGEQTLRRAANSLHVKRGEANYGATKRPGTTVEVWYLMKEASE